MLRTPQAAAHRALMEISDEAETFAVLTGGLGAWLALEYGSAVEQKAYKEAQQKIGYQIEFSL